MSGAAKRTDCDVVVIGAGVAGLAATALLKCAGLEVRCLEARDRIGGRILTVHDPLSPIAVELGAEFVHGRPPALWKLIGEAGLLAYEHSGSAQHFNHGPDVKEKQVGEIADRVLSKMGKSHRRRDESFEQYLQGSKQSSRDAGWARVQIEGFNAARRNAISAASLKEDADAAAKIDGGRMFRIPGGYDGVVLSLLRAIPDYPDIVRTNAVVHAVQWRRGFVEVSYRSAPDHEEAIVRCRQIVITLPVGVLKAAASSTGVIRFDPEPTAVFKAARALESGQVYRVTFRFREAFWEEVQALRQVGFLISKDTPFMSWWTTHPVMSPLLTGWSAGTPAEQFAGLDQRQIVAEALLSLARILKRKIPRPEAFYFHDWQADPFSRGAYSYVPVGASRQALARCVDSTLFFAREAANRSGRGGTVDGAIESGAEAAKSLIALRKR